MLTAKMVSQKSSTFKSLISLIFSSLLIFTLLIFSVNCGDKKEETTPKSEQASPKVYTQSQAAD